MDKILVATSNSGKLAEIRSQLLKQITSDFEILSLNQVFAQLPEIPKETAADFAGNAMLKAVYYGNLAKMTAIADDSGLCVCDLGNRPGVHSSRFAIDETDKPNFKYAADKIFDEFRNSKIDFKNRPKAYFVCSLAVFNPISKESFIVEGRVDGYLVNPPRGDFGFGYDPIFVKDGMNKTFGELSVSEKSQISHRAEAFKRLKEVISEFVK